MPSAFAIAWDPKSISGPLSAGLRTCAPVPDAIALKVSGEIPSYVRGRLYRNGPGEFELEHADGEITHINHWFDGVSVVHRFDVDGTTGTVSYKNKRTADDFVKAAASVPKSQYKVTTFGNQDPCRRLLGNLFQMWRPTTTLPGTKRQALNVGVTLERIPGVGALVSRTDYNVATVLNPDSLQPERELTFGKLDAQLSGGASGAHGVTDPDTGAYLNYAYKYGSRPEYNVFEVADSATRVLASIKEVPAYLHSMAATRNYAVLVVYSVPLNVMKLAFGGSSFADAMSFDPNMNVKFYVISRADGGVKAVYEAPPFFCFHQVNAFERGDDVVVDLVRFENADVLQLLYRKNLVDSAPNPSMFATPVRFVLPGVSTRAPDPAPVPVSHTVLADVDMELPGVAPQCQMRDYRYAYGVSSSGAHTNMFNSLVKIDVRHATSAFYTPPNGVCGEPIFVPHPQPESEDHGVLLSVVLDSELEQSYLAVVDARDMRELARASVPQAVPLGFHGQYMNHEFNGVL